MFANKTRYIIHKSNQACPTHKILSTASKDQPIQIIVDQFISKQYPKQKSISIVFDILMKHKLINSDLVFEKFSNIHVADFCSFINNRFDKNDKPNSKIYTLCRYLQQNKITFPVICIKNPIARKFLC